MDRGPVELSRWRGFCGVLIIQEEGDLLCYSMTKSDRPRIPSLVGPHAA